MRSTIVTATLPTCPDRHNTSTGQVRKVKSQFSNHLCKDINFLLLKFCLFYHLPLSPPQLLLLSWNNKQDRCFLPLYSLAPMIVNAPLPLYVTTFSPTPKVRIPACSFAALFCIPPPLLILPYLLLSDIQTQHCGERIK